MPQKWLTDILPEGVSVSGPMPEGKIRGLTADSRAVKDGFIFAALRGSNVDGGRFIPDAIKNGAVAILGDDDVLRDFDCALITTTNPRRALSLMAANFFSEQPETIAAVTGTAGKTSVAAFLRQIWEFAGKTAASIGTVGVVSRVETVYGSLTTPDPVALHETIDRLARTGVTHLALEASSHGLDQFRLDGVRLSSGSFTNLGRDHMDYHESVDDYFKAKMRLFDELLPKGAPMVVDLDSPFGDKALEHGVDAGCSPVTVGSAGCGIRLCAIERRGFSQRLTLDFGDGQVDVLLPLVGRFQVSNALVAAAQAYASGIPGDVICSALENLKGEAGRLEYVGKNGAGALIFVDYAHKVEALENVLDALRPYAEGRLIVVFGAGGDRDQGKRALMGQVATENADIVIVTDDNPRSEEPGTIRAMILEAVADGIEIGDRQAAIHHAVSMAGAGDVVVVAGKGHETGQIIGDTVLPFSDHEVIKEAINADPGSR